MQIDNLKTLVLTAKGSDSLVTDIFRAGPDGKQEAAAVFSNPAAAQKYLNQSGQSDQLVVAEVAPVPLMEWLLALYHDGVRWLVVDPDFNAQQDQQRQNTLEIEAQFIEAADRIQRLARPDF